MVCGQAASSRTFEHARTASSNRLILARCNPQSRGFVPSEAIAQKLPLPRTRYRALGRIDRELERVRQKPADARHDPFPCLSASDIDIAVVRIPAEGMAPAFQFPIQSRQQDVRQQRTERPALRRAFRPRGNDPLCHHPRFEIPADEAQDSLVADLLREPLHQNIMIDTVEGSYDILPTSRVYPQKSRSFVSTTLYAGRPWRCMTGYTETGFWS